MSDHRWEDCWWVMMDLSICQRLCLRVRDIRHNLTFGCPTITTIYNVLNHYLSKYFWLFIHCPLDTLPLQYFELLVFIYYLIHPKRHQKTRSCTRVLSQKEKHTITHAHTHTHNKLHSTNKSTLKHLINMQLVINEIHCIIKLQLSCLCELKTAWWNCFLFSVTLILQ